MPTTDGSTHWRNGRTRLTFDGDRFCVDGELVTEVDPELEYDSPAFNRSEYQCSCGEIFWVLLGQETVHCGACFRVVPGPNGDPQWTGS